MGKQLIAFSSIVTRGDEPANDVVKPSVPSFRAPLESKPAMGVSSPPACPGIIEAAEFATVDENL